MEASFRKLYNSLKQKALSRKHMGTIKCIWSTLMSKHWHATPLNDVNWTSETEFWENDLRDSLRCVKYFAFILIE